MADFPNWAKVTAASGTWVSAGWATNVMVQASLAQARLKEAAFTFSSLASFLNTGQGTQGYITGIHHVSIAGVSASQHHARLHAGTHLSGGDDPLPYASAGRSGLITAGAYSKINSLENRATWIRESGSSYVGATVAASQFISLGWAPLYVKLLESGSTGHQWTWITRNWRLTKHIFAADHQFRPASLFISTDVNGFWVRSSCNRNGIKYFLYAAREG